MSPKLDGLRTGTEMMPEGTKKVTKKLSIETLPSRIKRHPDFERMEKLFGLELHSATAILLGHSHLFAAYAIYLTVMGQVPVSTFIFDIPVMLIAGFGITGGCHRYWSHRTFQANKSLQILLMILQTCALQVMLIGIYPIHKWCLDHRIHHKYTDTDKDPHNSQRGFFFSHVGWLISRKHPEFQKTLDTFDVSDLENDPIVRFQSRWYWTLVAIFHTAIPVYLVYSIWGLPLLYCVAINYRRYVFTLHCTWCVNSVAHIIGDKPYDKSASAVQNPLVALFAGGEGWHNYHHTFPWDYRASEFGWKINFSTMVIDFFAWLGWATEMKTVSQKMLKQRLCRTGDGSHVAMEMSNEEQDFSYNTPEDVTNLMKTSVEEPIWGWDDDLISDELRKVTNVLKPVEK